MGPGRSNRRQLLEQPRIGRGIGVGLGVARDGLAEKVEREGPVPPALDALAAVDPDELTPKQALEALYRIKAML